MLRERSGRPLVMMVRDAGPGRLVEFDDTRRTDRIESVLLIRLDAKLTQIVKVTAAFLLLLLLLLHSTFSERQETTEKASDTS